jgi:hypothetical protein
MHSRRRFPQLAWAALFVGIAEYDSGVHGFAEPLRAETFRLSQTSSTHSSRTTISIPVTGKRKRHRIQHRSPVTSPLWSSPWIEETLTVHPPVVVQNVSYTQIDNDDEFISDIIAPAVALSTLGTVVTKTPIVFAKEWQRLKRVSRIDKEAIAKLGIAFGLTYNLVSNINGSVTLSLAWYMASKKVPAIVRTISLLGVVVAVVDPYMQSWIK